MEIIDQGVLFSGHQPSNKISAFPAVCCLKSGKLIAAFQNGPEKNDNLVELLMCSSDDGGKSWSRPVRPFTAWAKNHEYAIHVGYLTELESGKILASLMVCDRRNSHNLPFFNPETGGALPMYIGLAESLDEGVSWSLPRLLETTRFDQLPVPVMGPVICGDNGRLLLPFEVSKSYLDATPWCHYAGCLISDDNGKTWDKTQILAHDPNDQKLYWDNKMAHLQGGHLLELFWTYNTRTNQDEVVHLAHSYDNGDSWNDPVPTSIIGQVTFPIRTATDKIIAISVDRFKDSAIKLYSSNFECKNWQHELTIYKHSINDSGPSNLNDNLAEMQYWSFGLPCGTLTKDGNLLFLFYSGTSQHTQINWVMVR